MYVCIYIYMHTHIHMLSICLSTMAASRKPGAAAAARLARPSGGTLGGTTCLMQPV